MPDPWEIPRSMLRQITESWHIVANVIVPGGVANGFVPLTAMGGGGIWATTSEGFYLRTPEQVKFWRSIEDYCNGGARTIIVPICDRRHFPAPEDFEAIPEDGIPHSDDTPHSDEMGYDQGIVIAAAVSAAALNASVFQIAVEQGGDLTPGMFFSIKHTAWNWRLYRIYAAREVSTDQWEVTIRPNLREAIAGSTPIEFDTPRCLMRLATPDAMRVVIERRKFTSPSWAFMEAARPESL